MLIVILTVVLAAQIGASHAATIVITFPEDGAYLITPTAFLNGTVTDTGSGVQKVEVSVDAGPFLLASGTTAWSFTTSELSCGVHTITAKATDNIGNSETASIKISDYTNPVGIC